MAVQIPFNHWLSVDLSSPKGTLAIHKTCEKGNPVLMECSVVTLDGNHSENFIPKLDEALQQCGCRFNQIDRFITTAGPGSFTGLRIALASLKALAYTQQKPIDLVSGSEARALSWLDRHPENVFDEIFVLTYLTLDRFIRAHLKVSANGEVDLISETEASDFLFLNSERPQLVLVDDRISTASIPTDGEAKAEGTKVEIFPLEAKYLAEALPRAKSRKTYSSLTEWIQLAPTYFGNNRW